MLIFSSIPIQMLMSPR
ncbi:hypothetical protein CGLO_17913 [Colletotrichum gloeosporioides Cg-14]|uniref:Uncharacterized protein n=1 Tax=Colletotrichum gloeosporioides (strain Cg-14) TaxID=1237896 RepID=T0JVP2_COLGC|nr:hypothetical protein CGLO_17913 [Colletotrichum gloeosporioides Cg-14]